MRDIFGKIQNNNKKKPNLSFTSRLSFKTCMWLERRLGDSTVQLKKKKKMKTKQKSFPVKFFFYFYVIVMSFLVPILAKEANRTDFESEFLTGIPEVVQHDVGDRKLLDFGRVDLENGFSVTFPRLQRQTETESCKFISAPALSISFPMWLFHQ